MRLIYSLILFIFLCQTTFAELCDCSRPIIQMPIYFDEDRIQLTRDYIIDHYHIKTHSIVIDPLLIVLHWTGTKTRINPFFEFYPSHLSNRAELSTKNEVNVSVHYLVDRDGTIFQLMPDNWMARHVIGLNYYAIGIENVGGVANNADLTEEQVKSNAYLVCYLKKKYPKITAVISHSAYLQYIKSPLWLEQDANYFTIKYDTDNTFVQRVIARGQVSSQRKNFEQPLAQFKVINNDSSQ